MGNEDTMEAGKPVAILEPEEHARHQKVQHFLDNQAGLVRRARAALEQTEFIAVCVQAEQRRLWMNLCATHGLDAEADYDVDKAGRVYKRS